MSNLVAYFESEITVKRWQMENNKEQESPSTGGAVQSAMTLIPEGPSYVMLAISLVPEMFMNSQSPLMYLHVCAN